MTIRSTSTGGRGTPLMLKAASTPGGLPIEVFDQFRASVTKEQFNEDLLAFLRS